MKCRGSVRGRAGAGMGSGPGVERVITHYLLKWVRYLGYMIVGVNGRLSRNENGDPTADYTLAACDEELGGVYFYIAKDGMHIQPTPKM